MFGTHTRAVLKRRQAMDLGSGRDPAPHRVFHRNVHVRDAHPRALKRRQAMDLGSGRDPVNGSPPPCPPPSVSQERSCSGRTPAPC